MLTTNAETTCEQASIDPSNVYGLDYPPSLVEKLGKIKAATTQPIHILPTQEFADLHLKNTLAHAPDTLLFPFLHGLEGDNYAQILFFKTGAVTSTSASSSMAMETEERERPEVRRAKPPRYRGLLIVGCSDDMEDESDEAALNGREEDDVEGYTSDYSDDMDMDIDSVDSGSEAGDVDGDTSKDAHMHPVAMRTSALPAVAATAPRLAPIILPNQPSQSKTQPHPHPSYTPEVYVHASEPPNAANAGAAHDRHDSAKVAQTYTGRGPWRHKFGTSILSRFQ